MLICLVIYFKHPFICLTDEPQGCWMGQGERFRPCTVILQLGELFSLSVICHHTIPGMCYVIMHSSIWLHYLGFKPVSHHTTQGMCYVITHSSIWLHHLGFKPVSHHTTQGMCYYTQQHLAPPPWLQACEPPYYTRHVLLHTAACRVHHLGFKPVSHHTTQGMCYYTQQHAGSTTLASCQLPYYTRHVSLHTAPRWIHHLGFKPVSHHTTQGMCY